MESVQARRRGDNVLGASTFIEGGGGQLCMVFMSQGWKKNVARPGLEPRVSRLPFEHSNH